MWSEQEISRCGGQGDLGELPVRRGLGFAASCTAKDGAGSDVLLAADAVKRPPARRRYVSSVDHGHMCCCAHRRLRVSLHPGSHTRLLPSGNENLPRPRAIAFSLLSAPG
ncbi:uncharacterized protein B0H18DRAFT_221958 [Fomitopsis serialis]|uniref:uncharacterized protein n=1 Tax=Fomitopsis serialis TaxID=139415 RepID=UPI002008DBA0|nr:uncharacterized protein B0H18DRAFT_221958 [Neoantrodia serialis]KAH9929206.1 hypothetical protein B0H18DRAFT_221958 [Neoantrodia serialis]